MALTLEQLIAPITADSVLETFLTDLEALSIPARSWRVGGTARTILKVVATTYAGFTRLMSEAIKSGFLETAAGDWLTLLAINTFGVTRIEATFASGKVTLTNTGGGVYTIAATACRFLWTATGKAYTNTAAFTLNPGTSLTVDVLAVEAGSASSAPPAAINSLETVLSGVTVTNASSVVGSDAETDPTLRTRCRNKLAAISVRGPRGAYAYAVSSALRPDGTPVDINRSSISPSSSTGVVNVYVASPSGIPSALDISYVVSNVEVIARPDSVTANVLAVTAVAFTRTLIVWTRRTDGVSAADVKTLVENLLTTEIKSYPIGGIPKPPSTQGYLYADYVAGVCKAAHSSVFDVDGTGVDLALNAGQVATLTALVVDVRVVDVP